MNQTFHHENQKDHTTQCSQRQFYPKEIYGQHCSRQQTEKQYLLINFCMKCPYHKTKIQCKLHFLRIKSTESKKISCIFCLFKKRHIPLRRQQKNKLKPIIMRALFVFSGLLFYLSAFSQNAIRFAYDAFAIKPKSKSKLGIKNTLNNVMVTIQKHGRQNFIN